MPFDSGFFIRSSFSSPQVQHTRLYLLRDLLYTFLCLLAFDNMAYNKDSVSIRNSQTMHTVWSLPIGKHIIKSNSNFNLELSSRDRCLVTHFPFTTIDYFIIYGVPKDRIRSWPERNIFTYTNRIFLCQFFLKCLIVKWGASSQWSWSLYWPKHRRDSD